MLYPGPYPYHWRLRCSRCHQPYRSRSGASVCGNCDRFITREYERSNGRNLAITLIEDRKPRVPETVIKIIKAFTKWPVMHIIESDSEYSNLSDGSD
jgi:hypothetical protein